AAVSADRYHADRGAAAPAPAGELVAAPGGQGAPVHPPGRQPLALWLAAVSGAPRPDRCPGHRRTLPGPGGHPLLTRASAGRLLLLKPPRGVRSEERRVGREG